MIDKIVDIQRAEIDLFLHSVLKRPDNKTDQNKALETHLTTNTESFSAALLEGRSVAIVNVFFPSRKVQEQRTLRGLSFGRADTRDPYNRLPLA